MSTLIRKYTEVIHITETHVGRRVPRCAGHCPAPTSCDRILILVNLLFSAGAEGKPQEEDYDNASIASDGPNPLHKRVNENSDLVYIRYDSFALPLDLRAGLAGGYDGPPLRAADYMGTAASGLAFVNHLDDVDIVCVPDHVHHLLPPDEQHRLTDAIINLCERSEDCVALLAIRAASTTRSGSNLPTTHASLPSIIPGSRGTLLLAAHILFA